MKTLLAITVALSVSGLLAQAVEDANPAPFEKPSAPNGLRLFAQADDKKPAAPPTPVDPAVKPGPPSTPALPTTPTAPPLPEQFKKYDANGNGKLDQEEIAAIRKDRETETLKKYDKNSDGKLDETEKAAQMEDMKKRREEILARRKTQLEKPTEKPTDKPTDKPVEKK